jgi:NADH-quinone oxidoreductase subunit C/D
MRTVGIGAYDTAVRARLGHDGAAAARHRLRLGPAQARPYSGYEQFDFEVPLGRRGDCFDRTVVRADEIRESLKIIRQCLDNMPSGPSRPTTR